MSACEGERSTNGTSTRVGTRAHLLHSIWTPRRSSCGACIEAQTLYDADVEFAAALLLPQTDEGGGLGDTRIFRGRVARVWQGCRVVVRAHRPRCR